MESEPNARASARRDAVPVREVGGREAAQREAAAAETLAELFDPGDFAAPHAVYKAAVLPSGAARPMRRRAFRSGLVLASKALILTVLGWGLVFNFSEVRGSSMMPGIHDHDRILVDHLSYILLSVDRGDVVVLRYPLDPSLDYIKRVVGLPGDQVVIADGRVWINEEELPEPYVAPSAIDPYTRLRTVVQEGHYFVLGDNRIRSSDSREFGQVPSGYLRGKVRFRLWPLDRLGVVR